MKNSEAICSCAACGKTMFKGEDLVQNPVIKCGDLHYIELAHRTCLPEWSVNDNFDFSYYQEKLDAELERESEWLEAQERAEADAYAAAFAPAPAATLADLWPA